MKSDREIAAVIVGELFRNGLDEEAQRLVLTVDTPVKRELGGWSRRGAEDQILRVLSSLLDDATDEGAQR